ncbi:hypothetical protein SO802_007647 [Lithocarpus litseifolius]|uniref:RNase H type-1 domain-containing protein n=1 Tax=Lithocarpus litseifolius TaxID=425828 RepID=A0AAW2DQY9_9ROSI
MSLLGREEKLVYGSTTCKLGDGRTIDVWTDPWVPWLEGFKPQPKVSTYTQNPLKAFQLIDQHSNFWNSNMIADLFSADSARAILAIPIPYNSKQDKLIWVLDSKGMFSVKSIYDFSFRSSSGNNQQNNLWKKLWKARLPERLKMLLWRIGVDTLPTKESRADIHKAKHNVISRFVELSKTFSALCPSPSVQPILAWIPPPFGWVKLNVDAALNNSSSALAVVARNHLGEVLFIWGSRHHLCTPSQAEAAAILWAVHLAIQEQWMSVIIEGDAQVCFNALSLPDHIPDWNISTIVSNINSLLSSFVSCKFKWIRRSNNSAAHAAARFALSSLQSFCFNKSNLPHSLEVVCKGDCSLCS